MAYFVKTVVTLQTEDGEELAGYEREYKIENLTAIAEVFDHGGKTLALLAEGIEKLGLQTE